MEEDVKVCGIHVCVSNIIVTWYNYGNIVGYDEL